ncbi:MAG: 3-dehydroquinate synthase, partial [Pseudomonadota bacterium]
IIAFGGGVVGDLAGFCAATLRRGCQFIQIPTTILAQVDSSVGGKTAINTKAGKNLVGAFHQPRLVVIDTALVRTLPLREVKAGYAEILKYGLLGDADFFSWLEDHGSSVIDQKDQALLNAIKVSCEAKAATVAADERETGARALLNLGHTFGHALEAASGYSGDLLHGEAVAAGMAMAFRYSASHHLCKDDDVARVVSHLKMVGLPTGPEDIPALRTTADDQLSFMYQDKKVEAGQLTLILTKGIGQAFVAKNVPSDDILSFLQHEFKNVKSS